MPQRLSKGTTGKGRQVWALLNTWIHPTKNSAYLSLVNISLQKIQEIDALLPEILVIKEYCNLTGQEHFGLQFVNQNFPYTGFADERRKL